MKELGFLTALRRVRRFAQLQEPNHAKCIGCWYLCWYLDVPRSSKAQQNPASDGQVDSAILTIVVQQPRTAEAVRKNPLGIYVNGLSWSRDAMTRSIKSMLFLSASSLVLVACAAKTPPPSIVYDTASFAPTTLQPDPPKPVKIVESPKPLPLPGQLKPAPSSAALRKIGSAWEAA